MNKQLLLKQQDVLHTLSEAQLQEMADHVTEKEYEPGDILINEGELSNGLYFLVEGVVYVYNITDEGAIAPIIVLHKNQTVGEMAVITGNERAATVEAISPVKALFISTHDFLRILEKNSTLAYEILKDLSTRLKSESDAYHIQKTKNLDDRALILLQELVNYFPDKTIPLSHEKIAHILGVTRPRLTEALQQLDREGKISHSFNKILVLDLKN